MTYGIPEKPQLIGWNEDPVIVWANFYNPSHTGDTRANAEHVGIVVCEQNSGALNDLETTARTLEGLAELKFPRRDVTELDQAAVIAYLATVAGNLGLKLVQDETKR